MASFLYCYCDSWKKDNFRERTIKKEAKNCYKKDAKRIKSDNFTRGERVKSNIVKNEMNDWMAL